jgi:hypothetical protein
VRAQLALDSPAPGASPHSVTACTKARAIVDRFIKTDAYDTIDFPVDVVDEIMSAVAAMNAPGSDAVPVAGVFTGAASKAVSRMAREIYPAFTSSQQCADLITTMEQRAAAAAPPGSVVAQAPAGDKYYYPDETKPGEWQGPFTKDQLSAWFEHSHFDAHEIVRHGGPDGAQTTFGALCRPDLHPPPGAAAEEEGALPLGHHDPSHAQWVAGNEALEDHQHDAQLSAMIRRTSLAGVVVPSQLVDPNAGPAVRSSIVGKKRESMTQMDMQTIFIEDAKTRLANIAKEKSDLAARRRANARGEEPPAPTLSPDVAEAWEVVDPVKFDEAEVEEEYGEALKEQESASPHLRQGKLTISNACVARQVCALVRRRAAGRDHCFMYRYILRESCSQFDSLPLTYVTIVLRRRSRPLFRLLLPRALTRRTSLALLLSLFAPRFLAPS